MNIQVLFSIMSDRAAYHSAVAETVPCKLWANSSDMFTSSAANNNAANKAQMIADQFKNNRNELLYDYTPGVSSMSELELSEKPAATVNYLFTASTRAIVTMPARQSFVSNASLGVKTANEEYIFEDVLEDVTPTNVIQFVPRGRFHQSRT